MTSRCDGRNDKRRLERCSQVRDCLDIAAGLIGLNLFVIVAKPVDLNSMLPPADLLREIPYPFEYVLAFLQEPW